MDENIRDQILIPGKIWGETQRLTLSGILKTSNTIAGFQRFSQAELHSCMSYD